MNWEQFLQIKESNVFGFISVNNEVLIKSENQRSPRLRRAHFKAVTVTLVFLQEQLF